MLPSVPRATCCIITQPCSSEIYSEFTTGVIVWMPAFIKKRPLSLLEYQINAESIRLPGSMGTFKTVDCWILKHQQRPGNYGTHQRLQGFITTHWNTLRKQKQHLSYHCVIKMCRFSLITCAYQGCSLRLEPMEACTGWETGYILDNSLVHHSSRNLLAVRWQC